VANKDRNESKCGGGTTLASDSVAQKIVKNQNSVCATLSHPIFNKEALKLNRF
jgi:hypothetical protein